MTLVRKTPGVYVTELAKDPNPSKKAVTKKKKSPTKKTKPDNNEMGEHGFDMG
jgi:hypothetical protein